MKHHNSISSTNPKLRNPKKREELATRFALSSSRIEGIKPTPATKKKLLAKP